MADRERVVVEGSTNIQAIEYESGHLFVQFANGKYCYRDVSYDRFKEFAAAPSKGQYFYQNIRGRFNGEKVSD